MSKIEKNIKSTIISSMYYVKYVKVMRVVFTVFMSILFSIIIPLKAEKVNAEGSNVTVTFEANGGYFSKNSSTGEKITKKENTEQKNKTFGEGCDANVYSPKWEQSGEKGFKGWIKKGDDESDEDNIYSMNGSHSISSMVITEDTVFLAVWGDYHTVTFDSGSGYFKSNSSKISTKSISILDGNYISSSDVPYAYNDNTDMAFAGWKSSDPSDEIIYSSKEIGNYNKKIYQDYSYEAVWIDTTDESQLEGYVVITFDAGEGKIYEIFGCLKINPYLCTRNKKRTVVL